MVEDVYLGVSENAVRLACRGKVSVCQDARRQCASQATDILPLLLPPDSPTQVAMQSHIFTLCFTFQYLIIF